MASILKTIFLLVIAFASVLALYLLVPFAKEGWPTRSPLYVFGVVAFLGTLMSLWHVLWTRSWRATKKGRHYLGLVIPAIPLLLYVYIGGLMAFYGVRADIFSSRVTISRYHDTLLYWPGFEQPVGVHLELELDSPFRLPGSFLNPKIVIVNRDKTRADRSAIEDYLLHCGGPATDPHPCLTAPLSPYRAAATMKEGGPIRLAYDLFPANIGHLEDPTRICLKERAPNVRVDRKEVRVLWLFGSEGDVVIDLGEKLTERLRRESSVKWTSEILQAMYLAFRDDTLVRLGYRACDLHRSGAYCYCRPNAGTSMKQ